METFPWEVGEAAAPSSSSVPGSTVTAVVVAAAERSEMHTICSAEDDDDDVARIGGDYGWEGEGDARSPDLSFPLDLGLTGITKYSSYSKLWRMLYFINDAPFCIREAMAKTYMDLLTPAGLQLVST